jgi:hypothetical protein
MHKVKASDLVTLRRSLAESRPDVLAEVRERMPEPLRATLDATVASAWLPDPQICELYGYFARALHPGAVHPFIQLGREMALMSYRGVYRVFLSIPSTSFVMSRAAAVWASYHSTGKATIEDAQDRAAVLVVRDADPIEKAMIDVISGHILALAELTGAKDPRVVSSGDARAGYRWAIRWS